MKFFLLFSFVGGSGIMAFFSFFFYTRYEKGLMPEPRMIRPCTFTLGKD